MGKQLVCWAVLMVLLAGMARAGEPKYEDKPFWQDEAVKFLLEGQQAGVALMKVASDRNGAIRILSSTGLLRPYKERLVRDRSYRPLLDMQLRDLVVAHGQFMYLTGRRVFSNAWAGTFEDRHAFPGAQRVAFGEGFTYLLADSAEVAFFAKGRQRWRQPLETGPARDLLYDPQRGKFWILTPQAIFCFAPKTQQLTRVFQGTQLTSLTFSPDSNRVIVGTTAGYFSLFAHRAEPAHALDDRLPWPEITCVRTIAGRLWFGSRRGAFVLHPDGGFDYYASRRWLVDDEVVDIAAGPDNSVLVLTKQGLSQIRFRKMTLAGKARYYQKLQRRRHIRYGLNARYILAVPGDLSTGTYVDSDNDGLWTSMYLGAEMFRYAVTGSRNALQNAYEAFEALERLDHINPLKGFHARSFERQGYSTSDMQKKNHSGESVWRPVNGSDWTWKSTTSSDESIGHFFAYSVFAELVPDSTWKQRAVMQIKRQMDHIIEHDWYLVDWDGHPTRWGRWNPDYVNSLPERVGDRKLNSMLIISFLQSAYHFTGDPLYRRKAYELMKKHGYLKNLTRAMADIGFVEGQPLADEWNHSDDEMYFLCYWILYRYAFNDTLKAQYRKLINEHWEIERPECNPIWSFVTAMTGAAEYGRDEAIWTLQHYPLDFIAWSVQNSHRKDLKYLPENFRRQRTEKVLPPDERPLSLHNGNAFRLDGGEGGRREYPGYIYLLPYWMGRYVGAIGPEMPSPQS